MCKLYIILFIFFSLFESMHQYFAKSSNADPEIQMKIEERNVIKGWHRKKDNVYTVTCNNFRYLSKKRFLFYVSILVYLHVQNWITITIKGISYIAIAFLTNFWPSKNPVGFGYHFIDQGKPYINFWM